MGHNQVVTLQPIVGVVGAPDVKFKRQIPNEDSRLFDFDDSNLYSLNRFSGYDLLDGGSRVNYGGQADWQHVNGGQAVVFLGQSYTMSKQEMELGEVGFAHRHSDYVGRVDLSPHPILDLKYKFRLDRSDMRVRRSDLGLSTGTDVFRVKADYFYFQDAIGTGDTKNREQVQLELSGRVTEQWAAKTHVIHDLGLDKTLEHRVTAEYKNECVTVTTGFFHTFYQEAEVKADKGIFLKVSLKNLGM
jgi:LPS-assembly protein